MKWVAMNANRVDDFGGGTVVVSSASPSPSASASPSPSASVSPSPSASASPSPAPDEYYGVKKLLAELQKLVDESIRPDADILRINFMFDLLFKSYSNA